MSSCGGVENLSSSDVISECSDTSTQSETSGSIEHIHSFSTEWFFSSDGHYHLCECGEKDAIIQHTFGSWEYSIIPTTTTEGEITRKCLVCGYEDRNIVDKLNYYTIDIYKGNKLIKQVRTDRDGSYCLEQPSLSNGEFFNGYYSNNELVSISGKLDNNLIVEENIESKAYEADSFESFKKGLEAGVSTIKIMNDIEVNETLYVNSSVVLTATSNVEIKRHSMFGGDIFVVGEDKDGIRASTYLQNGIKMNITPEDGSTIAFDGNEEVIYSNLSNPTVSIVGSMFFVEGLAELNLNEDVIVRNNKKIGNARTNEYKTIQGETLLSNPDKVGGSAVIVIGGVLNINGASFLNNVANKDSEVEDSLSTQGGAIYNFGVVNVNDGLIKENEASFGGGIFSYGILNVNKGEFLNNVAYDYGGALYQPASQYSESRIVATNANDILIKRNFAYSSGGAMFVGDVAASYIDGVIFIENESVSNGGAINTKGTIDINNSLFESNICGTKGGAVYAYYGDKEGKDISRITSFSSCVFTQNEAALGGAIGFGSSVTVSSYSNHAIGYVDDCTFEDNNSKITNDQYGHGAAMYLQKKAEVYITKSSFVSNVSEDTAGAIYVTTSSNLFVSEETEFDGNQAKSGGAIFATESSSLSFDNVSFINNHSTSNGGAIYLKDNANAIIRNGSTLSNNSGKGGGAIYVVNSTINLDNVSLTNNSCTSNGGALYIYTSATGTFNNVVASNNSAAGYGGVMYASGASTTTFRNISSDYNNAGTGGFIYFTTTNTKIYIYSGHSKNCTSTTAGSENLYGNSTKSYAYIKGTTSKEYFDYDGSLIAGASTIQEIPE